MLYFNMLFYYIFMWSSDVYLLQWGGRTECDDEYIGKSARTFEERYNEHLKAPSPIFDHDNTTGHKTISG